MKFLSWTTLLAAYISSILTYAVTTVGQASKLIVYDWTIVPNVMLFVLIPAVLGYLVAKED